MVELQSWHFDAALSWGSPFHSLNPDASPAALRAVRSAPVSLVR
jgi:hypothetical protein